MNFYRFIHVLFTLSDEFYSIWRVFLYIQSFVGLVFFGYLCIMFIGFLIIGDIYRA